MGRTFATTRWTVIKLAGRWRSGDAEARGALETLCASYWSPLYTYARRRGAGAEDAADLVQGFFARLLEKDGLGDVDPTLGRFRAFLLKSFQNFTANEHDRARARKRGGAISSPPIDLAAAEAEYLRRVTDDETPERSYARACALGVMARTLEQLAEEQEHANKAEAFAILRPHLTGGDDVATHAQVAQALGISEGAVKVTLHRLRRRYGEILRSVVAETVENQRDVDDELRELLASLA
jgi:RNA polymerase sigma-70 factor (ECF subfamily)